MALLHIGVMEPRNFSKRGFGGGSVMTWAAISRFGGLALFFFDARMNNNIYQQILMDNLPPFLQRFHRLSWIFQQDNATIHVSRSTRSWFRGQ